MSDHPDIEKIDASVREIVRQVFRDPVNGTPDDISKGGCLALAKFGHEVWNTWRKVFPTSDFPEPENFANFEETHFLIQYDFGQFVFGDFANFSNCYFDFVIFEDTIFGKNTTFHKSRFGHPAVFANAIFHTQTDFSNVVFSSDAFFVGSEFKTVTFEHAVFESNAQFREVTFEDNATFSDVHFQLDAEFIKIKSKGLLSFERAKFEREANFSNAVLERHTSYDQALFTLAPKFHDTQLPQNFVINTAIFPNVQGNRGFAAAYRTLKLGFSKQLAIRDEQLFFRLEMAEEAALAMGFERYLYGRYKAFSDYGFSVAKPLKMLISMLLAFLFIYGVATIPNCKPDYCQFSTAWIEFTLVQALPLPGLDKLSESLRDMLFPRTGLFSVFVTFAVILHKAFSLLALFLIGLGLRNLFKLK